MNETLDQVGEWARDRIRAGQEPPWTYYKLMQLLDALEGLREGNPITSQMENSLRSQELPDGARQSGAEIVSLDKLRLPPAALPESSRT